MTDEKKRYTMIEECYVDVVRYLRAFDLSETDLEDAIQEVKNIIVDEMSEDCI